MSPKSLTSRHSIDSCLFQLHTWKPFNNYPSSNSNSKTLDSDSYITSNPNSNSNPNHKKATGIHPKRPCLSDRATSLFSLSIDSIDFSKLSLFDDGGDRSRHHNRREKFRWMAKKRRRRGGSRSVSGRSSDRSGTRNGRCCSVGATATATCSDFMVAAGGTDSSGELFVNGGLNGNANGWASDVSEARRERERGAGIGERDSLNTGFGFDTQGSESGYGSEPGYRGDAEFGYGDEVDDEEEDARLFLWGEKFGGTRAEIVEENSFSEQKHHRGRRKKHEFRMMTSVR